MTPKHFNRFLFFKLPSAWLCGVRVAAVTQETCAVTVRYKWINQNPFRSMFWAVQGMAAELSTGAMVILAIKKSSKNVSMLVLNSKASFTKKAKGKITFTCQDGDRVVKALQTTIANGEPQTFWMKSVGVNTEGVVVSTFDFEWTLKRKS